MIVQLCLYHFNGVQNFKLLEEFNTLELLLFLLFLYLILLHFGVPPILVNGIAVYYFGYLVGVLLNIALLTGSAAIVKLLSTTINKQTIEKVYKIPLS